jgi:putative FmdB family regulatory protein
MPLYEYFCEPCNGIFEELRPMREATEPVPCPQCYKDANRIMPTSFTAFTFREGYPRRIPDDGKYYHLGQKVSRLITGGQPNEHPEINKREPEAAPLRGDINDIVDMELTAAKGELVDLSGNTVKPRDVREAVQKGRGVRKATAPSDPNA